MFRLIYYIIAGCGEDAAQNCPDQMPSFILANIRAQSWKEESCFSCPQCIEGCWTKGKSAGIFGKGCTEGAQCPLQQNIPLGVPHADMW